MGIHGCYGERRGVSRRTFGRQVVARERERETGVVRVAKVFVVARGVLEGVLDARRGVVCSGKRKN